MSIMSEEEIEAIEEVKEVIRIDKERRIVTIYDEKPLFRDQLQTLLDLIEKQQKEIEEKNIAVNKMSKDISRQLEEIDEKSTIIMAGAEKVKQLEKEIQRLEKN